MRELPTLGGNNGYAAGGNNRGEIPGWAETAVFDPSCEGAGSGLSGQVLQVLPVIYGPGVGAIRALPLISGDSSGIGELVSGYTTAHKQGGELKLLNLTKKVHDLLQNTKLYTVFEVKDDEAAAVKSFN